MKKILRKLKQIKDMCFFIWNSLTDGHELSSFLFVPRIKSIVFVTGADSTHYKSLKQFLLSLFLHESGKVVVFNLGLKEDEVAELKRIFPLIDLRNFDFSQYPSYFNIKVDAGEYAWKPVIINDVLNEFKCCICWMDAGNIVIEPLFWLRKIINSIGLYIPASDGIISEWTHPKTLDFLRASGDILNKHNLNGACVAVNYNFKTAVTIIKKWKECALIKECIAPNDSSRRNHRQDQAVLSVLGHQSGITKKMPKGIYGFKTHQDVEGNSDAGVSVLYNRLEKKRITDKEVNKEIAKIEKMLKVEI